MWLVKVLNQYVLVVLGKLACSNRSLNSLLIMGCNDWYNISDKVNSQDAVTVVL